MASPPELALVHSYAHKTNPTLDGLPEEIFVNILELSVTFDKPLQEVLRYTNDPENGQTVVVACDKSPPLPLSILLVNKAIYRFAVDAFYRLNRFTVRFENIRIGSPGAFLVHCFSRLSTVRPSGVPASLDLASIGKLSLTHQTVKSISVIQLGSGGILLNHLKSRFQPSTETLLTYLTYLPKLKWLIITFSTATEFLALWKYVQTYKATATGIGEITIPGVDGRHHVLRFPDLAEAWEELSNTGIIDKLSGRTANCLGNLAFELKNHMELPNFLCPFLERYPPGSLTLRLQRRPGEPKRFLAFNLALLTYIMTEESEKRLGRISFMYNIRWDWSEGHADDQTSDFDETPEVFNAMYNRSMEDSHGWFGDADWSKNETLYNQLCTPTAATAFQMPQVVIDDGQHTGDKWLRSFWKSWEEYVMYWKYIEDLCNRRRSIIRFGGVLRQ